MKVRLNRKNNEVPANEYVKCPCECCGKTSKVSVRFIHFDKKLQDCTSANLVGLCDVCYEKYKNNMESVYRFCNFPAYPREVESVMQRTNLTRTEVINLNLRCDKKINDLNLAKRYYA